MALKTLDRVPEAVAFSTGVYAYLPVRGEPTDPFEVTFRLGHEGVHLQLTVPVAELEEFVRRARKQLADFRRAERDTER